MIPNGPFGNMFPYTNFHSMNLDWVIQVAKDFLDQYTNIQQIITDGETSLDSKTNDGLEVLQMKYTDLETLLQQWYDTHSQDIADELAQAVQDLSTALNTSIDSFNTDAAIIGQRVIQTIPADYSALGMQVNDWAERSLLAYDNDILLGTKWTIGYYLDPNSSNLIANENYNTSDYITAAANTTYYISNFTGIFIHYFDNTKTIIGHNSIVRSYFTTPANTAFVRISVDTTHAPTRIITGDYLTSQNILSNATWIDGIYIMGGEQTSDQNWTTTDFIPIYPGFDAVTQFGTGAFINYYSASQTWVEGYTITSDRTITLSSDASAKYIRISIDIGYKTTAALIASMPAYHVYGLNAFDYLYTNKDQLDELMNRGTIHIGSDYQYTTLREGIAYACTKGNCQVYVHPGEYDLLSEFADSISTSMGNTGIAIGNNVSVYFYEGAIVKAHFTPGVHSDALISRAREYFAPFYSVWGNWKLENLTIETTNTRYCVHDEMGGQGTYKHEFINCHMKCTDTSSNGAYYQCIGGGMGEHANIIIDKGDYNSISSASSAKIPAISYHNGNNSNAKGSITISNVYLKDARNNMRFGYYGPSTAITQVLVSGCSMGKANDVIQENPSFSVVNMTLTDFCNEIRA